MKKVATQANKIEIGVDILNMKKTKVGGIILGVDAPKYASKFVEKVVRDAARVRIPQRQTPVLLLNVPDWVNKEEVKEILVQAGVVLQELVRGNSCFIIRYWHASSPV